MVERGSRKLMGKINRNTNPNVLFCGKNCGWVLIHYKISHVPIRSKIGGVHLDLDHKQKSNTPKVPIPRREKGVFSYLVLTIGFRLLFTNFSLPSLRFRSTCWNFPIVFSGISRFTLHKSSFAADCNQACTAPVWNAELVIWAEKEPAKCWSEQHRKQCRSTRPARVGKIECRFGKD